MFTLKKIKPMFNRILVSMDKYGDYGEALIIRPDRVKGEIKPIQKVIAVGDAVKGIQEGMLVHLNLIRYAVMKHQDGSMRDGVITDNPVISYNVPTVDIDNAQCMLLYDQDVDYTVKEYEGSL